MDDDVDGAIVRVRADTRGFAADVDAMRSALEGPLGDGAERAGRAIETALTRAVRTGRLGFEDLQRVAASAMAEIARSAVSSGVGAIFGGGAKGGGLLNLAGGLLQAALGLPGRATGGPVTGGRGYLVGERGPELFVPTGAGRVEPLAGAGARDIRITVNIAGGGAADPQRLAMSGRRVAQAVRRAIELAED
jgi:phage-related minor tail protein